MSYRGRLTEAARERIRTGGAQISPTAWMLDAGQVDELVVDEVDVDIMSAGAYLILRCHAPDTTTTPDGTVRFDVTLDQATAMRILFASQLDETRARPSQRRRTTSPDVDPPHVTGTGDRTAPTREPIRTMGRDA